MSIPHGMKEFFQGTGISLKNARLLLFEDKSFDLFLIPTHDIT